YFDDFNVALITHDTVPPTPSQPVDSGDIVINEVLFSAKTGGAEFVEIYNSSNKAINLKTLSIAKRDLTTLQLKTTVPINTSDYFLYPQKYLCLTKDTTAVMSQYFIEDRNGFYQMRLPDLLIYEDIVI